MISRDHKEEKYSDKYDHYTTRELNSFIPIHTLGTRYLKYRDEQERYLQTDSKECKYARKGYKMLTNWPYGSLTLAIYRYLEEPPSRNKKEANGLVMLGIGGLLLGIAAVAGPVDLALMPFRVTGAGLGFFAGKIKTDQSKIKQEQPTAKLTRSQY